jgi:hypothetical protein
MEKPLKILFKKIPLNYSWIPFPQKLIVDPMLMGRTITLTDTRFSDYIKNIEKWDNELKWINTANTTFSPIAINKAKNPIAATLIIKNRGKIHFLPKTKTPNHQKAIQILIDLITNNQEPKEYPWLNGIEIPEIKTNSNIWTRHITKKDYRDLFSKDFKKIVHAVQLILEDLGITTRPTSILDLQDTKNGIGIQITSTQGKIEIQNTKINQLADYFENQKQKLKIMFIGNTYNSLPLESRTNKDHLDVSIRIFIETNNSLFLTTLSLFRLWKKVLKNQITLKEVYSIIQNGNGEIII